MRGKIIVIEGTDCSGKETQSKLLIEKLNKENIKIIYKSFPAYDTPTGKIVGGPYLGKPSIGECYFKEGATNVDPMVSALYFAADRLYNIKEINKLLDAGNNIILDRYSYSNMAHQGGKLENKKSRNDIYEWLEKLEFGLLNLPHADIKLFLHMPYKNACELKKNRTEIDEHEKSETHLINAEKAYLEVASKYDFKTIECVTNNNIRTIEDINSQLYKIVKEFLQTY